MITLISYILVLIGSVNWLTIGLFQFDFVAGIFGSQASVVSRIIYSLVGIACIWLIAMTITGKGRLNVTKDNFGKLKKTDDMLSDAKNNAAEKIDKIK
ncbi:MAG: DUF378 domain-containing protein [Clostridia bacterium]